MKFSFFEINESKGNVFDEFASQNPCSGFQQSFTWAKANKTEENESFCLCILEGEEIIAGGIFYLTPDENGDYLYCPDGPVLDWSQNNYIEIMETLFFEACERINVKKIMFNPRIAVEKIGFSERYTKCGTDLDSKYTRIIDLDESENDILAQMSGSGRRMIRIAEQKELKLKKGGKGDAEAFYELYLDTSKRNNFPSKSFEHISTLCKDLLEKRQGVLYLAYQGEEAVAGAIITYFGPVAYYLYAATRSGTQDTRAIFLVIWEAIKDARNHGLRVFDFGGITLGENTWSGFSEFKQKFGGRILEFEGMYLYTKKAE
ncbi:peptidoglycan bridge formation glycyltransferase FemA/FemB family protein [Patescibacteria group bacterium]|nr:peptidoglycan bridge formation glycyltransferase FemA/FemB family protein [Patescibacteria group bacterium]